jgi:hypothetical protein
MTTPTPTSAPIPTATYVERPHVPAKAPSQGPIAWTIAIRAVSDRMNIVGVLAFYGLALGAAVGALWPP